MTVPSERSLSIASAREFMYDLIDPKITPGVPRSVRKMASRVLRHFPYRHDINIAHRKSPEVFGNLDDSKEVYFENYESYRSMRAEFYRVRLPSKRKSATRRKRN